MRKQALVLSAIAFHTFLLLPLAPLWAQDLTLPPDGDRVPPVIQHEPPAQSAPTGKPLTVEVTITDNTEVLEAILYYRPVGGSDYTSLAMDALGQNVYTATIPKGEVVEPGLEYYVQASDRAGNMVLRGFSFSPLMVTVAPVLPSQEEASEAVAVASPKDRLTMQTAAAPKPWYKKWWVWTIVGGVVVAAAAGGGGGGGGGDTTPTTAGGPTTGSASISGPLP